MVNHKGIINFLGMSIQFLHMNKSEEKKSKEFFSYCKSLINWTHQIDISSINSVSADDEKNFELKWNIIIFIEINSGA